MGKSETDELVDQIEEIRLRLADTVDELIDRTNPKNVARRSLENATARFKREDGSIDPNKLAPVITGAIGVFVAIALIRRILK